MSPPHIALCQMVVGASFALAARFTCVGEPWLSGVATRALVLFEMVWAVPVTAYLLLQFPGWSTLYLMAGASVLWSLTCLGCALIGYSVARLLLAQRRVLLAWLWFGALIVITAGTLWGTQNRWLVLGSTPAFRDRSGELLRPLWGTPAGYILVGSLPLGGLAWMFNLWRLWLMDRASHFRSAAPSPESMPEISAQLLEVAHGTRPVERRKR